VAGTVSAGESLAGFAGVPGGASISSVAPGIASGGLDGSLPIIRTTLHDATRLFTGSVLDRVELSVPSEGTLFITVKDMAFPALTGSLSFALVEGGAVLHESAGPGSLEHVTSGPALLFAFVQSTAAPGLNIGSYHLNVAHETVIPLPATLWLLVGGLSLAGFAGRARRRSGAG
jgi:hypothetical protein